MRVIAVSAVTAFLDVVTQTPLSNGSREKVDPLVYVLPAESIK